jgi:hypothetical protein
MQPRATPTAEDRNAEHNRNYHARLGEIRVDIQQVIRDIWPRIPAERVPGAISCYNLVVFIKLVEDKRKAEREKKKRKEKAEGSRLRPQITALESAAKKFLKELQIHRADLLSSIPPGVEEYYRRDLDKMEAAQDAVKALFDNPPRFNPAKEMALRLTEAFQGAGLPEPQGKNREGRLCKAVTPLLALGGLHYGLDQVSDMLRDRWQRPRSGRTPAKGGGRKIAESAPTPGRRISEKVPRAATPR